MFYNLKTTALYDYLVNENERAYELFLNLENMINFPEVETGNHSYTLAALADYGVNPTEYADFLGIGKTKEEREAARQQREANKQARQQGRLDRQAARTENIKGRAAIKNAKAEGKIPGTDIGGIFNTVADTAKNIFGRPESPEAAPVEYDENGNPIAPKNNTMLYVGIGIVVVILVAVVILYMRKSKKA